MLFKSLGVAIATNSASSSDEDTKAVTIRLTDSEIQLYDTVAKSMGLTRQDFISHLIRSNFRQSLKRICYWLYGFKSVYSFICFV